MTATAAVPTPITAKHLVTEIRARYQYPEWVCEEEMTLGKRRLDVVAFNMWGARGHVVAGFEIKVARGDWMREPTQFQKSEEWLAVVDAFWVVTPKGLIRADELPDGWGHLELVGERIFTRRHATRREGSSVLPREIVARFVSRAIERAANAERNAEYRARTELREEMERQITEQLAKQDTDEVAALRTTAAEHARLTTALGHSRHGYNETDRTIRLLRMLRAIDADRRIVDRLARLMENVKESTDGIRELLTELSKPDASEVAA